VKSSRRAANCCAALLLSFGHLTVAAPLDTVKVDLAPLIDAVYHERNRFAVEISHAVTLDSAGAWSTFGTTATWTYTVHIPMAVSLSFHAPRVVLPHAATVTVHSRQGTYVYRTGDVHRGGLWSRVAAGDFLEFQLVLPLSERANAVFDVSSFQAGYRGFGPNAPMHPHYARLVERKSSSSNASCVQNYECDVTANNTAPGQATVALIISNLFQCSGTLLNDVPGDHTPFVLTARHCQTGKLGGGNPGIASSTSVYWDATSACGKPLATLYDPGIPFQSGAVTVVEQQDAWLIELDASPVVSDAYFAGFDATGGIVQGGYTVDHALSYDKQFTEWSGQAATVQLAGSVLNVKYASNFWEVVNKLGTVGPGSSGSGLFDQNDRLVGSLSLGRTTTDASGYEACPLNPPPVPNGSNGDVDFTSFAAVWASTADSTSTTGTTTLQQVLDPHASGQLVVW
jgi:lysyl endopeptidase